MVAVCYHEAASGDWILRVHAQPGARRTEVVGLHGDALKVRLQAPPVDGKANDALCRYLAQRCALPLAAVRLRSGLTGRAKQVALAGLQADPLPGLLDDGV